MDLILWLLSIHLLVCAALIVLRIFRVIRCEFITILIAILLPVWGFAILVVKRVSDIHQDREREKLEVEHMHAEEYLQSIVSDDDSADA